MNGVMPEAITTVVKKNINCVILLAHFLAIVLMQHEKDDQHLGQKTNWIARSDFAFNP